MKIFGIDFGFRPGSVKPGPVNVPENPFQNPIQRGPEITIPAVNGAEMEVRAGRASIPDELNIYSFVYKQLAIVNPKYPIEFLRALTHLATYNDDFSNAVWNVSTMANTPYRYRFSDDTSEAEAEAMRRHLDGKKNALFPGGSLAMVRQLLTQMAINGCVSAEIVIKPDFSGVDKVVLVSPLHIRFVYDVSTGSFLPYQNITNTAFIKDGPNAGSTNDPIGMLPLNPVTYKYLPLQVFDESPYAIPPFLSALKALEVDNYLMDNLKHVAKKQGVLGFLQALVNPPMQLQESNESYQLRVTDYLAKVTTQVEKGFRQGIAVGFKGAAEFNLQPSMTDGTGAKEIVNLNDMRKMSGFKQDPVMFGRDFQSSEASVRVIMSKLSLQLGAYQDVVASFISEVDRIELILAGFNPGVIFVEFETPHVTDRLKETQARQFEILNTFAMRDQGVISQTQAANLLGFDIPFKEAPDPALVKPVTPGTAPTKPLQKDIADQ